MVREQRRLAAILFVDAVGSSRLMGQDESGTVARLLEHLNRRFAPAATRRGGRMIRLTGDGGLVEFASAVDALAAAIDFQQSMVDANHGQPEDKAIAFRIGVHLGDVIVEGDDIYGDDVNVAKRLETEAPPGGIVVSRSLREAVDGRLKATLHELGDLTLKNIGRPIPAFRVAWAAADWPASDAAPAPVQTNGAATSAPPLSIAVLPFNNMSGDAEQEYFVDGLVEDIITALSRIPRFFVIARNSSFTYKGRSVDIRQVGRELGVRYVLEGSVRKAGNRLRITGQLIQATTGEHIWAERYDGALEDVFDLQDQITSNVVSIIEPKVQQVEIARAQRKSTAALSAYDLYLQAFALFSEFQKDSHDQALILLERAVTIDRNFSSAYGLMANICWQHRTRHWGSVADTEARGLEAAMRAVELGRDDPDALARGGLGLIHCGGDREEGLRHIERALTLNPNSLLAWRFGGWACWLTGDHDKSIRYFRHAMRLSPRDPFAWDAHAGIAFSYFFSSRYEEALAAVDQALLQLPGYVIALRLKLAASAMAGRPAADLDATMRRLRALEPVLSIPAIMDRFYRCQPFDRDLFEKALRKAGIPE